MEQTFERRRQSRGFTLIELMVVVIILGILAATIIPQFVGRTYEAKQSRAQADIATLDTALETFMLHMDRYPTSEEGLKALVTPPAEGTKSSWRGPYLKELRPDPWGNPYVYRFPSPRSPKTYDLWSRGADGADGGEGPAEDIKNWQEK